MTNRIETSDLVSYYQSEELNFLNQSLPKQENYTKMDFFPLFKKFCRKVIQVQVVSKTNWEALNGDNVIWKINLALMHYLSRGSKTPILSKEERGHRNPFNYLSSEDDKPTYYRGDGDSFHREIIRALLKDAEFSSMNSKEEIGVINPARFQSIMKRVCAPIYSSYQYKTVQNLSQIHKNGKFFDITDWITGELKKDFSNFLSLISRVKNIEIPENSFLGGVFSLTDRFGVYVFLPKDNNEQIFEALDLIGSAGAFPEMIISKNFFMKLRGNSLFAHDLEEIVSFQAEQLKEVQEAVFSVLENTSISGPLDEYLKLLRSMLKTMSSWGHMLYKNEDTKIIIEQIISVSLQNIAGEFSSTERWNSLGHYEQLQALYIGFEEALFVSSFIRPKDSVSLNKAVFNLFDESLQDNLSMLFFDSAMSSFDALLATFLNKADAAKPSLVYHAGNYYELKGDVIDSWRKSYDVTSGDSSDCDVLILDLFPNNVEEEMEDTPVIKLIQEAGLSKRNYPLVVILDISTTHCGDGKILDIYKIFQNQIKACKLQLVFVTSLAKFNSCGLDKYSGGLVSFIKCPCDWSSDWLRELKLEASKSSMSDEAKDFFKLLFLSGKEHIKSLHQLWVENTNILYRKCQVIDSVENSLFTLKEKSPNVPMLGLLPSSSSLDAAAALEKKVYTEAWKKKLPILIRASFPFAHSAIVKCDKAARFIVGLEQEDLLDEYVELFQNIIRGSESDVN